MNKHLKRALVLYSAGFAGYAAAAAAKSRQKAGSPDYLLILGCRVTGEEPSEMLKLRIQAAAEFLSVNPETKAIACGGIVHDDQLVSEAQIIKAGLVAAGIDESRIILEDESQTTYQNFKNASRIISGIPGSENASVAFLTSNFHILRASLICRDCGLEAVGIPAPSPKGKYAASLIREYVVFPLTVGEIVKGKGND